MNVEKHLLVALVAPGSVEAEVGRLQTSLFAATVWSRRRRCRLSSGFVRHAGAATRGLLSELDHCISRPLAHPRHGDAMGGGLLVSWRRFGRGMGRAAHPRAGTVRRGAAPAFCGSRGVFFWDAEMRPRKSATVSAPRRRQQRSPPAPSPWSALKRHTRERGGGAKCIGRLPSRSRFEGD